MPPTRLEPHYIGPPPLPPAMASSAELKSTELRLGPPGSESPDRAPPQLTLDLLPKASAGAKRGFADAIDAKVGKEMDCGGKVPAAAEEEKKQQPPASKAQVVGWPPIRSYRKNSMAMNMVKNKEVADESKQVKESLYIKDGADGVQQGQGCLYIKVSMDGAPYLRKVDLKTYKCYKELWLGLERMFGSFTAGKEVSSESRKADVMAAAEYVLTYEDKDGDWMLVGDVPWEMFCNSCRRLRIMKGSDAIGLAPRTMEKSKNRT